MNQTGRSQGHDQKGLHKSLYIKHCVICWPRLLLRHLQILQLQIIQTGNWWPWTSRWRRYTNV